VVVENSVEWDILSVLGHRQEELELRGQLLFRIEPVGEVDTEK
jgi:hypothetical protein